LINTVTFDCSGRWRERLPALPGLAEHLGRFTDVDAAAAPSGSALARRINAIA
jgi:hypothetical protein